jgi:hypothetical protein
MKLLALCDCACHGISILVSRMPRSGNSDISNGDSFMDVIYCVECRQAFKLPTMFMTQAYHAIIATWPNDVGTQETQLIAM